MKTQLKPWILASALILGLPYAGQAQETLGGLGAAGAMGATLGAAGAGSMSSGRITRGVSSGSGGDFGSPEDPSGMSGGSGMPGMSGAAGEGGMGAQAAPKKLTPPRLQSFNPSTGSDYVRELLASGPKPLPAPDSRKRTPRNQARYSSRVSKQTKTQRSKEVQKKYNIPPVNWRAAYLPQDRYKFGKVWNFVSTEDQSFYYTPAAMARKRFNPNRVIGFHSFEDALAAGYRPDPVSKPAPGAQIANLARMYRGPELYNFVEYVYAGQISSESFLGIYNYATKVANTMRPTRARPYIGETIAKILDAALTGDVSSIPLEFNSQGPIVRTPPPAANGMGMGMEGEGGSGMMGSPMGSPSAMSPGSMGSPSAMSPSAAPSGMGSNQMSSPRR